MPDEQVHPTVADEMVKSWVWGDNPSMVPLVGDASDPAFRALMQDFRFEVSVNGVRCEKYVLRYDVRAGWVERYVEDEHGKLKETADGLSLLEERVHGVVEVTMHPHNILVGRVRDIDPVKLAVHPTEGIIDVRA